MSRSLTEETSSKTERRWAGKILEHLQNRIELEVEDLGKEFPGFQIDRESAKRMVRDPTYPFS